MKIFVTFSLIVLACLGNLKMNGQILYNFTAATASGVPTNTTAGSITQGNNNLTTQTATVSLSATVPVSNYVGASTGNYGAIAVKSGALATSTSTYVQTTIVANAGYYVTVTGINWGNYSIATNGPTTFSVYASNDNFTTSTLIASTTGLTNSTWAVLTPPNFNFPGNVAGTVTLRIYATGVTTQAAVGTVVWRVDDLKITATATQVGNATSDLPSTINQLPKFTNTAGKLGNSQINDNGTNVGIGIAIPTAKLDVAGTVKATGLILPTAAVLNSYLKGDATGNATWAILDKTAVGLGNVDNTADLSKPISSATQTALNAKQNTISLTTNGTGAATLVGNTLNIPTPATLPSQWTTTGSNISNNNTGNVGIGTTTPNEKLELSGTNTKLRISGGINDNMGIDFWGGNGTYHKIVSNANAGNFDFIAGAIGGGHKLRFFTDGVVNPRLIIDNTGKLGIGTSSPYDLVTINGSDGVSGISFVRPTDNAFMKALSAPNYNELKVGGGNQGIVSIYAHTTPVAFFNNDGSVGIGTTLPTPSAKLEVNGTVKITGGTPGPGKVLTSSDASGLATWANAPTASSVNANNGLTISNNVIGLGGTLNKYTTINSMDSSLEFKFNNGSYNKIGILNGANPLFFVGTEKYIGNVQKYDKGRFIVYDEKLVSTNDWWDMNMVIDTLFKSVTSYANDGGSGFKWNIANYSGTPFNGITERPVIQGVEGQDFRLGFDFSGLYINGAYQSGAYNSNRVFQVLVDGTVKLKSPQNGTNQDSVLVWEAATQNIKKIAPSNILGNNLWSANGNSIYKTDSTGKVMIGFNDISKAGANTLAVNGSAIFTKATVKLFGDWPDYVFNENYKLRPLTEVEKFIQQNKHLPEVAPEKEVQKDGIDLGANQTLLLKKIEELTLYAIEADKKINAQQKQITELQETKALLQKMMEEINALKKKVEGNK